MKVNIGNFPKGNGERKVKVEISDHDCWNLDSTLAYIIAPALRKLKEIKCGGPFVSDADVPDKLKSTAVKKTKKDISNGTDKNWFKRWDYVLDEMIFAFESVNSDWEEQFYSGEIDIQFVPTDKKFKNPLTGKKEEMSEMVKGPKDTFKVDYVGSKKVEERMQNGFRLFGLYYRALWD